MAADNPSDLAHYKIGNVLFFEHKMGFSHWHEPILIALAESVCVIGRHLCFSSQYLLWCTIIAPIVSQIHSADTQWDNSFNKKIIISLSMLQLTWCSEYSCFLYLTAPLHSSLKQCETERKAQSLVVELKLYLQEPFVCPHNTLMNEIHRDTDTHTPTFMLAYYELNIYLAITGLSS